MEQDPRKYILDKTKGQIINTSLVVASIVGSTAFIFSFISRLASTSFNLSIVFETFILITLIAVTIRRKYISNSVKAYLIVSQILFLSLSDAYFYGLLSSTRVYLVLIPLYSIIYFPFLRSLMIYLLGIIGFIIIGFYHSRGFVVLPPSYEPNLYILRFYPWIINSVHISTVGIIILFVTHKFFISFSGLIRDLEDQNETISQNERNYREIFNSTNEAIFIHNASDGKIYDVNDVMLKMYGFDSKEEVLKLSVKDISSDGDAETQERAQMLIRKAIEEGPHVFEWKSMRKNGELFYSEISLKSTHIGGKGRVLAVVRDITERKLMEQKVKESEEQYRSLVETSQDGISLMDLNGRMIFVNSRKAAMVGIKDPNDLVGQNAFSLLTTQSVEKVNSIMSELMQKGYYDALEAEVKRLDGSLFTAEFNVTVLEDSKGNPKYLMDTMRDITERKRAEKALKESEERYRTIIEAFPEIIMVSDLEGRIIFANDALERVTGITPADYPNKNRKAMIHPDDVGYVRDEMKKLLSSDIKHTPIIENRFIDTWGNEHWFSGIISKIHIDNQLFLQTISRDVTEKKIAERELEKYRDHLEMLVKERTEELQASNEELSATNEELFSQREELEATLNKLQSTQRQLINSDKMASLGVLAAGIAHEINNPLNFIHGGIAALDSYIKENFTEQSQEVSSLLEIMNTGVKRAAKIVRSLDHYTQKDNVKTKNGNLHNVIDNCLLLLSSQFRNKIRVDCKYYEKPFQISYNEGKIHQAIINILTNSIQSIKEEGTISLHTNLIGSTFEITIKDSGCGIDADILSKVTDPFFTTKDPGVGTGLGLSITQSIINEHNGTLEIQSEVGKGTQVIIKLPLS